MWKTPQEWNNENNNETNGNQRQSEKGISLINKNTKKKKKTIQKEFKEINTWAISLVRYSRTFLN